MSEENENTTTTTLDTGAALAELERLAGRSMETGQSPYFQLALIGARALVSMATSLETLARRSRQVYKIREALESLKGPDVAEVRVVNDHSIPVEVYGVLRE